MNYPTRNKLCALADANNIEVFHVSGAEARANRFDGADCASAGWYYWQCFPGCLPEGDAMGPFPSALAALRDAYDNDYLGDTEGRA